MVADGSGLHPAAHAEQATVCPTTQRRWIGRARRIFAVRGGLLNRNTGCDALASLLSATQAERRRRHQPIGQDGEGLVARPTESASHPNAFVLVIVGLTEPPSMADDRVVQTNRTLPRQEVQGDHPGSMLSFASGSAIKRITAGVKARRDRSLLKSRSAAGPSPSGNVSFERKKNTALRCWPRALTQNIGRYIATIRSKPTRLPLRRYFRARSIHLSVRWTV